MVNQNSTPENLVVNLENSLDCVEKVLHFKDNNMHIFEVRTSQRIRERDLHGNDCYEMFFETYGADFEKLSSNFVTNINDEDVVDGFKIIVENGIIG